MVDTVIGAYWPIKGEFDPLPACTAGRTANCSTNLTADIGCRWRLGAQDPDLPPWYPVARWKTMPSDPKPKDTEQSCRRTFRALPATARAAIGWSGGVRPHAGAGARPFTPVGAGIFAEAARNDTASQPSQAASRWTILTGNRASCGPMGWLRLRSGWSMVSGSGLRRWFRGCTAWLSSHSLKPGFPAAARCAGR
jgi:hypothetical protein